MKKKNHYCGKKKIIILKTVKLVKEMNNMAIYMRKWMMIKMKITTNFKDLRTKNVL